MTPCRLTEPHKVLSGLDHCQEIWLVLQLVLDNVYRSCPHFSALLVVTSKDLCKIQLFLSRLDYIFVSNSIVSKISGASIDWVI